jgi:FtsP/CotA-like multicopper oxidase with cupredoxin domain
MPPYISRRQFLALSGSAVAATTVLGSCGRSPSAIGPSNASVAVAERRRRGVKATIRDVELTAGEVIVDLGGRMVRTWGYNGMVPGPEIRVARGEVLRVKVTNRLPEATSVHWHGVALRNDMDGVPGVTQKGIDPGASFTYEFAVAESGTFWFHPHSGLQLDKGLYAPLIIDDPSEPGRYDREAVVVVDDWTDGVGESPDAILGRLTSASHGGMAGMGGMGGAGIPMAMSAVLGGDAGDVSYPVFVLNGAPPTAPATFDAKPGERIRLRLINAGADTAFRVALGGHRLTVTHSDGFPVEPVTVDAVLLGMGERYDAVVTVAGSGAFPLVALAEGKNAQALGVLRSGSGAAPPATIRPTELDGRLLTLGDLRAGPAVALSAAKPDRTHPVVLSLDGDRYRWRINGRTFADRLPLDVRQGERARLVFDNRTTMFHPMHLHGHTFEVRAAAGGGPGPRKDTVIVRPGEKIAVDFVGDNPGQWVLHCHNVYHMESGMMTTVSYVQ